MLGEGAAGKLASLALKGIDWEFPSATNVSNLCDKRAIIILTHAYDNEIPRESNLLGAISDTQKNVFSIMLETDEARLVETKKVRSRRNAHLRELYHEEKELLLAIMEGYEEENNKVS